MPKLNKKAEYRNEIRTIERLLRFRRRTYLSSTRKIERERKRLDLAQKRFVACLRKRRTILEGRLS